MHLEFCLYLYVFKGFLLVFFRSCWCGGYSGSLAVVRWMALRYIRKTAGRPVGRVLYIGVVSICYKSSDELKQTKQTKQTNREMLKMKKNIVTLTVLLALASTAQAADMQETNHNLNIKGNVIVDGCAFEDETVDGQELFLQLDEVSLATVKRSPTTLLNSLGASASNTLVCPAGIDTVKLTLAPVAGMFTGDIMHNSATADAAAGVGFKVAAAFGEALNSTPEWVDFSLAAPYSAQPDADGKIAINFGANYVLTSTMDKASAGAVEANLPFTISYM